MFLVRLQAKASGRFCFMGRASPKPCCHPGCGALVYDGGRCAKHALEKVHGSAGLRKTGRRGVSDRQRIMRRDHGLCQACLEIGITTPAAHVDHIVPLSAGGSDEDSNKRALCIACHLIKSRAERRGAG